MRRAAQPPPTRRADGVAVLVVTAVEGDIHEIGPVLERGGTEEIDEGLHESGEGKGVVLRKEDHGDDCEYVKDDEQHQHDVCGDESRSIDVWVSERTGGARRRAASRPKGREIETQLRTADRLNASAEAAQDDLQLRDALEYLEQARQAEQPEHRRHP
jgi:hypothetical protein